MPSVDNRLVRMEFDNQQFMTNLMASSRKLNEFKGDLASIDKAASSFDKVENASKGVKLEAIANAVESVKNRFSAMGVAGMTAVSNLTNTVVNAAKRMASAFGNMIIGGGVTRALNIEQAKFLLQGLISDQNEVNAVLKAASDSVDQTAFGYDVAAKAAAQFAASGMRADDMVSPLRALAGVAATTGAEYDRVAQIFTKVSGNGRLMGDDLLQFSAMGMNAAATLAKYMGTSEQAVREMVSDGKIDFATFAAAMDDAFGAHAKDANKTFTGTMSNIKASFSRMGASFISPLIEQEGALVHFLNTVKDVMKKLENALSPFAETVTGNLKTGITGLDDYIQKIDFERLFEGAVKAIDNLLAALKPVKDAFKEVFGASVDDINAWIQKFAEAQRFIGDRLANSGGAQAINELAKVVLSFIKQITDGLGQLADIAGHAFREVFAEPDVEGLKAAFGPLWDIIGQMKMSESEVEAFSRIFQGLFAGLHAGSTVFAKVLELVGNLLLKLRPVGDAILELGARVGDFLVSLDAGIQGTDALNNVFNTLKDVLGMVADILGAVGQGFADFFKGFATNSEDVKKFTAKMNEAGQILGDFQNQMGWRIPEAIRKTKEKVHELYPAFQGAGQMIGKVFGKLGELLKGIFSGDIDVKPVMNIVHDFLNFGILGEMRKFVQNLNGVSKGLGGIVDNIKGVFGKLNNAVGEFTNQQMTMKPRHWLQLAIAVGLLAAAMALLAQTDPVGLATGIGGLAAAMGMLVGYVKLINHLDLKGIGPAARAISRLGLSMITVARAVKAFGEMGWEELVRGMTGFATALGAIVGATVVLEKTGAEKSLNRFAWALIPLSAAMNIFAASVHLFGGMDSRDLTEGLLSIITLLGALTGVAALLTKTGLEKQLNRFSWALIPLSTSMILFSVSVNMMGSLEFETIVKGLGSLIVVLGSLTGVAALLTKMGLEKELKKFAWALIPLSASMLIFQSAIEKLGNMELAKLVQGIVGFVASLGIFIGAAKLLQAAKIDKDVIKLSIAMSVMSQAIGSFSGALNGFADSIKKLGETPFNQLVKGILGFVSACGVLIVFFKLTKKIESDLWGISGAVGAVGGALNAMTESVVKLSDLEPEKLETGLRGVAGTLTALAMAMRQMKDTKEAGQSMLLASIAIGALSASLAVVSSLPVQGIATGLAGIAAALVVYTGVANALGSALPKLKELSISFLELGLSMAGIGVGVALLTTAFTTVVGIFTTCTDTLKQFFQTIIELAPLIVEAVFSIITALLDQITLNAPKFAEAITALIKMLLDVIVTNIPAIAEAGLQLIIGFLTAIRDHIYDITTIALQIIINFINGIAANIGGIIDAAFNLIISFIDGLATAIDTNHQALFDAIGHLIEAIGNCITDMIDRIKEIGGTILENIKNGIGEAVENVKAAIGGFFDNIINGIKDLLGINSPSTVFQGMGNDCAAGYQNGVTEGQAGANAAGQGLANSAIDGINSAGGIANTAGVDLSNCANNGIIHNTSQAQNTGTKFASSFAQGIRGQLGNTKSSGQAIGQAATQGIQSQLNSMTPTGQRFGTQFASGLRSTVGAVRSAAMQVGQSAMQGISSVQGNLTAVGRNYGNNFVSGIRSSGNGAYQAGRNIAERAKSGMTSISTWSLGNDWANGFANGINDRTWWIEEKARRAARAAKKAADDEIGNGSPSREMMKSGRFFIDGFAIGIRQEEHLAISASERAARVALGRMRSMLSEVGGFLEEELDPVISPRLDLSQVTAGTDEINAIFSQMNGSLRVSALGAESASAAFESSRRPSRTYSEAGHGEEQPVTVQNTFNQYNSSPKALDRLEIYRRTKNLFAMRTNAGATGVVVNA